MLGQKVDQTAAAIAKLTQDFVDAVVKRNAGQHFMTVEVYEQICALEQQGMTQDLATNAATDTVVGVIEKSNGMAGKIVAHTTVDRFDCASTMLI